MTSERASGEPSYLLRAAHLLVLWTFALPQPTFAEIKAAEPSPIANAAGIDLVLFALGLTLVPPALMLLAEMVAARAGRRALNAVHLLLVSGLVAMIASPVIFRLLAPSSLVQSALALGVGGAFGVAYSKLAPVRFLTTALVPATLLFVLAFLFTQPAVDIVLGAESDASPTPTRALAPVVFVVFDEFNSAALMDASGNLDAKRYPNFARLASDATWFRNAYTDHSFTLWAVPTLLTGRNAPYDSLPWASDHPRSLFTMLGGYHLDVREPITDVCPERLCPERGSFPGRLPDLYRDLTSLGLTAVLPDAAAKRLPKIDPPKLTPQEEFAHLVRGIHSKEGRTLHFAHVEMPHSPHVWLPSGKTYPVDVEEAGGRRNGGFRWIDNRWLALQGYQRYLLQVGYTDRMLGKLLDRLKETGVYDRAAIVITADHGVSHRPGEVRRYGVPTNLQEIMPVPLFVKAPHQTRGRTVDRHIQARDVLPGLADILGIRPPPGTEGTSAFDPGLDRRSLRLANPDPPSLRVDADTLDGRRTALVRRQARLFGTGDDPERLFDLGLDPPLRGRSIAALPVSRQGETHARILEPASFSYNPRSTLVPARLAGQLSGAGARPGTKLVIALNGRIRAATRTYAAHGQVWFTAMIPPSRLRSGRNKVEVFGLSGSGRHPRLELLAD